MPSGEKVVAVAIAATIVMAVFNPLAGMVASSSGTQTVTNATFQANIGDPVELDGYNVDNGSETIYWYNSTSGSYEEVDSSYYDFAYATAEITVENGTEISEGDDMKASYTYQATSGSTTTLVDLVPLFAALLVLGILAKEVSDRA